MSKTAIDITLVYVSDDKLPRQLEDATILNKLMTNELEYYGEYIPNTSTGKTIIYMTDKKELNHE